MIKIITKDELDQEINNIKVVKAINEGYDYNDKLFEGVKDDEENE